MPDLLVLQGILALVYSLTVKDSNIFFKICQDVDIKFQKNKTLQENPEKSCLLF